MHGECSTNLATYDDDGNDYDSDNNNNDDDMTWIMKLACTSISFCFYQNFLGS